MNILIAVVLAMILAQLIKTVINRVQTKKLDWSMLIQDGGMPSSHSAVVSALSMSVFFEEGKITVLFVVVIVFSLIVINDAYKARRTVGLEAHIVNEIAAKEKLTFTKLNERQGHTPLQVLMGAVLGIVITLLIYSL